MSDPVAFNPELEALKSTLRSRLADMKEKSGRTFGGAQEAIETAITIKREQAAIAEIAKRMEEIQTGSTKEILAT